MTVTLGCDTDAWKMRKLSRTDRHNQYCQKLAWLTWLHVSVRMRITMKVYLGAPLLGLQLLCRGGLGGYVVLDLGVRHGVGGVELERRGKSSAHLCSRAVCEMAGTGSTLQAFPLDRVLASAPSYWTKFLRICRLVLSPLWLNLANQQ